jgi:hypothetical protein
MRTTAGTFAGAGGPGCPPPVPSSLGERHRLAPSARAVSAQHVAVVMLRGVVQTAPQLHRPFALC